ncbi:unnamed protein product [Rotaria sp. Silwood1]|nr:unnamed protein product [Rotaria sp. Silwood1]CAF0956978.1 unnamed protein product [Rotaria sp. Silwood1]CAF3355918.1 unnamed protein product [Rotaria sp. Silwood1]CAF4628906.1 unnamed protein product [Rotaria sp. Silwood1]
MGNDVSSSTARTLIPLDDSVCWQLYNGVNERSEPISIFIAKQTFSVECRRSIQFLKTIRHPNIIKFFTGFKTFVDQDSFIADCVHPLANKLHTNDIDSSAKICLGLYQLSQALEFLHEKASISHNNICLLSLYISLNGIWKLGNFECACRYDNLNKKYLSSLKIIRAEECITPEENEKDSTDFDKEELYAIDVYGFGILIRNLLTIVNVDDSLKNLLNDLQISLTEEDPQSRPTWQMLLKTQFFQIDYIKVIELLDRLPTVDESDLSNVVDSLSTYLDSLDTEYFNELLIRRLCLPFMFLCSLTRSNIIPRIIIPKDINNNSWISIDQYRLHVIPHIVDLFSYHVTCIRETLLEHYNSYWQLIDRTIVINIILPQLIYGLKDSNNTICMLTLIALASMVPVIGADVIIGGQRKQIFTDKIKKENVALAKTAKDVSRTNSPLSTPTILQKPRKTSPVSTNKTKPLRLKPTSTTKTKSNTNESLQPVTISPEYTNGNHLSLNDSLQEPQTTVIQNGLSDEHIQDDIDNDDGQWSDWEHNPDPTESSINDSQTLPETLILSSPISEQSIQPKSNTSALKPLKLMSSSKSKWDPNAPLGSEYEMPSVVLTKKKLIQSETPEKQDTEDFFKDMTPKVETVELMQQLETMFKVNKDHPNEQIKSTITTTSFSSKFGIMSQDQGENQEIESGNNNWDE